MPGRSSTNVMRHRCVIERDASRGTASDRFGHDAAPSWGVQAFRTNCHFWFEEGSTRIEAGSNVTATLRKMIVPIGTDVTEDDRVLRVEDRRGQTVADGPMKIDSIGRRADHLVLMLADIR